MAASAPTPEEKLFSVIQGAKHKPLRRPASALSLAAVRAQVRGALAALDVPKVNQALVLLMVPLGLFCAFGPILMRPSPARLLAQARERPVPFVIPPPLEGVRPAEELIQLVRTNDPFGLSEPAVPPAAVPSMDTVSVAPPPPNAQQLLADLRLVGIARGQAPTAMVEQVSQNTTNVLRVGDQIAGFTVKAILDDRVVFDAGGQELELF